VPPTTRLIRLREGVNDLLKTHFDCTTSREVARHIGVDESTWSRAIRGRSVPGPKLSELLLQIEGVSFGDLFEINPDELDQEAS
jgi:transcriptional regulator with XRE-family HTH domain